MDRERLARILAPAAFLAAVTVAVLLVRAGLSGEEETAPPAATIVATTTAEDPATTPDTTVPATTTTSEGEFYEIERGDTLASVADQFDTTVEELMLLNPDVDPVALSIGERIRVK